MRYWTDDQVAERDLVEGETFWDYKHPVPAVKGVLLHSNGENVLYEMEAVPGSARKGTVISPVTFNDESGTVVDVIVRRLRDDDEGWIENTFTVLLSELGFNDSLPESKKVILNPAFDRAMEIF